MADSYTPQVGDTVRIVIEDQVTGVGPFGAVLAEWRYFNLADSAVVSIEKVEPPVTQYVPGDVIRLKADSNTVIALADGGGYVYIGTGQVADNRGQFVGKLTSEYFDKIDVT